VQFEAIEEIEIAPNRTPLPDQELVFNSKAKLNSVPSTRRSGKTTGIVYYGSVYALQGEQIAICYPTYDECSESFILFENSLEPFLASKNGINKKALTFRLLTKGSIRFFSYEAWKKIRGKKFNKVFCDEFQECLLEESYFMAAMLPTLSDLSGQAWFLGTPKKNTLIETFHLKKEPEWMHYVMRATNNPRIGKEEIEFQRRSLPPLVFAQEWEGEFVDFDGQRWMYEYNPDIHLEENIQLDREARILLGLDFNVDPCTCLVSQKIDDWCSKGGGLNILKEITSNKGSRECAKLTRRWLEKQGVKSAVWITGDVSGSNKDSRANITDYQIWSEELGIPLSMFINTTKANANLAFSRDMCNTLFYNQAVFIDKNECPILCKDLATAKPKEGTDQLIKDRTNNKNDSLDAFRYIVDALFHSIDEITRFAR